MNKIRLAYVKGEAGNTFDGIPFYEILSGTVSGIVGTVRLQECIDTENNIWQDIPIVEIEKFTS